MTVGDGEGALCWVAKRASEAWDFIDKRDIDKHVVVGLVILATARITTWGMAAYTDWLAVVKDGAAVPGIEAAAMVAAVLAPWSLIVSGVVKWYFNTRSGEE